MLQIKKKAKLMDAKYLLQLIFRSKALATTYSVKKTQTQSIYLRAPKNFNIGKQKIFNLNYKSLGVNLKLNIKFYINAFISNTPTLFTNLCKYSQTNTYLAPKSIKIRIKTKFTIMWLEYLFLPL